MDGFLMNDNAEGWALNYFTPRFSLFRDIGRSKVFYCSGLICLSIPTQNRATIPPPTSVRNRIERLH